MEIQIYSQPSQEIKDQLFELVQSCHVTDGTYRLPYLDNAYNFDVDMPAFFLANLDHQTVGFLSQTGHSERSFAGIFQNCREIRFIPNRIHQ